MDEKEARRALVAHAIVREVVLRTTVNAEEEEDKAKEGRLVHKILGNIAASTASTNMLKKSSFQHTELQWLALGDGPALLLLHGFTESYHCWEPIAQALAATYKVLVPDLPGSGGSALLPAGGAAMDEMARAVLALMDTVGVDQATVIGHSMGGYVALEMLALAPERLAGIGLVHAHPLADDAAKQENRNRTVQAIEKRGSKSFLHGFIPHLFCPANRIRLAGTIQQLEEQAAKQSVQAYIAQTQGMRDRKARLDLLKSHALPKLVLLGAADPILPAAVGIDFASELDNCQLEVLADAAHMAMYESPEKTLGILAEFLNFVNLKQD